MISIKMSEGIFWSSIGELEFSITSGSLDFLTTHTYYGELKRILWLHSFFLIYSGMRGSMLIKLVSGVQVESPSWLD